MNLIIESEYYGCIYLLLELAITLEYYTIADMFRKGKFLLLYFLLTFRQYMTFKTI